MTNNYKNDERELAKVFLNQYMFPLSMKLDNLWGRKFTSPQGPPQPGDAGIGVEVIVRPECNQKCDYCYIAQHGEELYPLKERVSNEQLLDNLDSLLDYIYNEQKTYINRWEFFAGDLFYDDFFFDMCEVLYSHWAKVNQMYKTVMVNTPLLALIPCNFSFMKKPLQVEKVKEWVYKFKEINVNLVFSCSTDGKYATDTREKTELTDEYWDTLFSFLKEMGWCCHPMVSVNNIEHWVENYDWWVEQYHKYNLGFNDIQPMMLEVRNDDWTPEKIDAYLNLLNHMLEYRLSLCDNDVDLLAYHLFKGDGQFGTLPKMDQYDPIRLPSAFDNISLQKISCSIQGLLHISLNNLTVVPCHRLAYKQFSGIRFIQDENGKICDYETNNLNALLSILFVNAMNQPGCHECLYSKLCLKGCLGAQYETNGDLFQPAMTVCDLEKSKINFLISKYYELGIIQSAMAQGLLDENVVQYYSDLMNNIKQ